MTDATRSSSKFSRADFGAILDLIDYCAHSNGTPDQVRTVFGHLDRLIPLEAAVIAIGSVDGSRLISVDRLHSHGPNPWLDDYHGGGLARFDPVVQRGLRDLAPFRWSDASRSHPSPSRRYLELKRDFDRTDGIAATCRGRRRTAQMTLISAAIPERHVASRHLRILDYLLPHVHEWLLAAPPSPTIHLTPRETEVLRWIVDGKSNWEIGTILSLSERTVKFHVSNVFAKLGAANRSQAVAKAIRHGLAAL